MIELCIKRVKFSGRRRRPNPKISRIWDLENLRSLDKGSVIFYIVYTIYTLEGIYSVFQNFEVYIVKSIYSGIYSVYIPPYSPPQAKFSIFHVQKTIFPLIFMFFLKEKSFCDSEITIFSPAAGYNNFGIYFEVYTAKKIRLRRTTNSFSMILYLKSIL